MSTAPEAVAGARTRLAGLLVVPATLFVALMLIGPLAILFRYSLNKFVPGQFMVDALVIENYVKFFTDAYYLNVLARTIRVAVICTLACLIMGFPLAYVLARTQSRFKNLMVIAVVLPLFVGNAVRAAGWMTLFGSKGAFNASLMGLGLISQPLEIMYTENAVLIGIIAVNLPFMVLTLQSVIEGIPRNVEEAAFSLGAGPVAMFRRVLWPLALPGTLAGTILTFILAMNAYATPVLLGGTGLTMMAPALYDQITKAANWGFGSALAWVLVTVTLAMAVLSNGFIHRRYRRTMGG